MALPAADLAGLDAFLGGADFYGDGDHLYVTDGERLFVLAIGGQDWGQLDAWPPGRTLHEMPREAFEAILGARAPAREGMSRWRGCDTADQRNLLALSLLAGQAVKGGEFLEIHIPASPGPELYLLLGATDWAAVLAGRPLAIANACEIAADTLRRYQFDFNADGHGALFVTMAAQQGPCPVYEGPWHGLATRVLTDNTAR